MTGVAAILVSTFVYRYSELHELLRRDRKAFRLWALPQNSCEKWPLAALSRCPPWTTCFPWSDLHQNLSMGSCTEVCRNIWLKPGKNNNFHGDLWIPWLLKLPFVCLITMVFKIRNVMIIVVTSAIICAWLLSFPIFRHCYSYANAPEVFSSADVSYLPILLCHPPSSMRSVGHLSQIRMWTHQYRILWVLVGREQALEVCRYGSYKHSVCSIYILCRS